MPISLFSLSSFNKIFKNIELILIVLKLVLSRYILVFGYCKKEKKKALLFSLVADKEHVLL